MAERAFSPSELAAMNLPGLPTSKRGINLMAQREGWQRDGAGRITLLSLSAAARAEAARREERALVSPVTALQPPGATEHRQRRASARTAILARIDQLVMLGHTKAKAIEAVVASARAGTLPPELQSLVRVANARAGSSRTLTRATLFNWSKSRDRGAALLPAMPQPAEPPAWAPALLSLYARPSKPGLAECLDAWPRDAGAAPSYGQARRFIKSLDTITRNRGRLGPRALRSMRASIARDVSHLWPGAVFIGDGHTFKAEVAHPLHGRPFRPEVTAFLDVFTRRWVGWSAALAENTWSVADALRHAVTSATCCDVVYYDNGSGAKNRAWDADAVGLTARLAITKHHSAPWSSQARGVIERFNATVFHRLARTLPTYSGPRMDDEARNAAYKITRADIRIRGTSALLLSWDEFKSRLETAQRDYNTRPHSALARIVDPVTAKRRPLTPDEAWQRAIDDGWEPEPISAAESIDLFRPHLLRKVTRATVALFAATYFHPALEGLHGDTVQVGYDIHDPSSVVVRLSDGRFVCTAGLDANKRPYLPLSFLERAREKRVAGKLKRIDRHRETALAESADAISLLPAAISRDLTPVQRDFESAYYAAPAPPLDADAQKIVRFRRALAIEGMNDPSESDRDWLERYRRLPEATALRQMFEDFGEAIFET